ncbi:MAG: DNA polymerase III subunit alpha, partial [Ignavibacteriae bacterium]|nr:DNA polymerase III subunit alpha [Ignavibacteriota bacterium]
SAGILKMDFLGLRTLTIIRDTIDLIKISHNITIDVDSIPVDDEKTYKLFSNGQTTGVFQFESAPMKEHLKNLKPTSIKDLSAMNALYRPGPMDFIADFVDRKHGRKPIEYLHPLLAEILSETYGIIVYQEQVIQIANKIAGMSLAEADILRRAMGKKDLDEMARQKNKFVEGAIKNSIPKKIAEEIFVVIDKFANYGFNKSHAVAYSIVAYQTAYLKANYTAEFLAANLTNEFGNPDKVTLLLEDCRKLKIHVMVPNINRPSVKFTVDKGEIVFGMSAIKNVGINAVKEIERAHKNLGRNFKSIYDFTSNIDTRVVNKRALEGLVLAGSFDSIKGGRAKNFASIENALSFGSKVQAAKLSKVNSLFGDVEDEHFAEPDFPDVDEWEQKYALAKEREALGFYLSDHPLRKYETEYNSFSTIKLGDPDTFKNEEFVRACGVVTSIRTRMDKSGRNMAFFKLDDFSGSCECIMFGKVYAEVGELIVPESTIMVMGKLESSGDSVKLHAEDVIALSEVAGKFTKSLGILMDVEKHTPETVLKIKTIFEKYSGTVPVVIYVRTNGSSKRYLIDNKISINDHLILSLQNLLGEDAIAYQT